MHTTYSQQLNIFNAFGLQCLPFPQLTNVTLDDLATFGNEATIVDQGYDMHPVMQMTMRYVSMRDNANCNYTSLQSTQIALLIRVYYLGTYMVEAKNLYSQTLK